MDKKDFYGVRLNNYFSPSFCLNHKMYFGTLNNIREFIRSMRKSEQSYMIRKAFKRYMSGETDATHRVAYTCCFSRRPASLYARAEKGVYQDSEAHTRNHR